MSIYLFPGKKFGDYDEAQIYLSKPDLKLTATGEGATGREVTFEVRKRNEGGINLLVRHPL